MPNSHSCESVLREIVFGLNSLRRVTAPFHPLLCPLPLALLLRISRRYLLKLAARDSGERARRRGTSSAGGRGVCRRDVRSCGRARGSDFRAARAAARRAENRTDPDTIATPGAASLASALAPVLLLLLLLLLLLQQHAGRMEWHNE